MDAILTDEWIDGHQHLRIERVLISRCQVEGDDLLPLVLRRLIDAVWSLVLVAADQDVEVNGLLAVRYLSPPAQRSAVVIDGMKRLDVCSIQEAHRPHPIRRTDPSGFRSANACICFQRGSPDRAILNEDF